MTAGELAPFREKDMVMSEITVQPVEKPFAELIRGERYSYLLALMARLA
jgi:hypothetical protein